MDYTPIESDLIAGEASGVCKLAGAYVAICTGQTV